MKSSNLWTARFWTTIAIASLTIFTARANKAYAAPAAKPQSNSAARSDNESKKFKVKYKEKTNLDFSDALIEGAAKNPFMSMIGTRDQEFSKGFIKIRYNWHDQLIISTSGLTQ